MDDLTLTEAIYVMAVARDDVDETNITVLVRRALAVFAEYTGGRGEAMHTLRTVEQIDGIIAIVTENGTRDIFA